MKNSEEKKEFLKLKKIDLNLEDQPFVVNTASLFNAILKKLKEDKWYFLSLVVIIICFVFFSIDKVKNADGAISKSSNIIEIVNIK